MSRILAIEADARRRHVLTALVREHVKAELVVVASVQAALASMADRTPDLIIAPALLFPPDEAELLTYVKQLRSAPYVQMVTVPALDMLVEPTAAPESRRSFFPIFNRRPTSLGLQYDRGMVAAQIADGLARSREMRIEYAAMLAYQEAAEQARPTALVPCPRLVPELPNNRLDFRRDEAGDERRIALRKGRGDVPWLSGVKAAWGTELELINISSTGLLVETGSKFTPGSTTELHLSGPDTNLIVPVRFIRSDVARIDGLGVRYRAAAAFAREVISPARAAKPACPQRRRRSSRRSLAACWSTPRTVAIPRTSASRTACASSLARAMCRFERVRLAAPAALKRSISMCPERTACGRLSRSRSTATVTYRMPTSG